MFGEQLKVSMAMTLQALTKSTPQERASAVITKLTLGLCRGYDS